MDSIYVVESVSAAGVRTICRSTAWLDANIAYQNAASVRQYGESIRLLRIGERGGEILSTVAGSRPALPMDRPLRREDDGDVLYG